MPVFIRWRSPKVNIEGVLDRVALYYGNLLDFPSVRSILAEYKPDVIFHLAAQSYVDFSFWRYELYPQTEICFLRAESLPD